MPRKSIPLRIDPAVYNAIAAWANQEMRSVNAQIEVMLRDNLRRAGRLPKEAGDLPKRGRPKKTTDTTKSDD